MTLIDFLRRLLGRRTPPSASTARQRLQLVLAHDRSDLNPELLEQMRREILEVVQRYVEIDLDGGDVTLETADRVTTLVANLPIKRPLPFVAPLETSVGAVERAVEPGDDAAQATAEESETGAETLLPPLSEDGAIRSGRLAIDTGESAPVPAWVSPAAVPPATEEA